MAKVWNALPEEFRFDSPDEQIRLWRADRVGRELTGMLHKGGDIDPVDVVLESAQAGPGGLLELIDQHTSSSIGSPLVSATRDLRLAQLFAEHPDETIYELAIPAGRLLRDPNNTGTPRWPKDTEVLVVGNIEPTDISSVKVNNQDRAASELYFVRDGRHYTASFLSDFKSIPKPENPNPKGKWKRLVS